MKRKNKNQFEDNIKENIIEGRNSVLEALNSDRAIDKILISKGKKEGSIIKILNTAKQKGVIIQEVDKNKLNKISHTGSHQGVIAYVSEYSYVQIKDIFELAKSRGEEPFIVILDEITDPHNLGSIIRSANVAGAHGIIIPKRRSAGITAAVTKSSAGAVEYTNIARVTNIARTIEYLKAKGVWIVGADVEGQKVYYEQDLKGSIALVIGSEGKGMRRLVKESCDFLVKIPVKGEISSLNASVAAGILMFEISKQKENFIKE